MRLSKKDHIYPIKCGHRPTMRCPKCQPLVERAPGGFKGQRFAVHAEVGVAIGEFLADRPRLEVREGTIGARGQAGKGRRK